MPVVAFIHFITRASNDVIYRSNIAAVFLFEKIIFRCRIYP
jgi:hypothetical protein